MSQIDVFPYTKGDLSLVSHRDADPIDNWQETMEAIATMYTVFVDGSIVMVTGFATVWNGVAEAFVVVDREHGKAHALKIVRIARNLMHAHMGHGGLHRIHAACVADDVTNNRFMLACGFVLESVARKMSPFGGDMNMYALTRDIT